MSDDIAELRRLLDAATPGPWEAAFGDHLVCAGAEDLFSVDSPSDASLIVALRNAAPALIRRLEAAEKVVAMARAANGNVWAFAKCEGGVDLDDKAVQLLLKYDVACKP